MGLGIQGFLAMPRMADIKIQLKDLPDNTDAITSKLQKLNYDLKLASACQLYKARVEGFKGVVKPLGSIAAIAALLGVTSCVSKLSALRSNRVRLGSVATASLFGTLAIGAKSAEISNQEMADIYHKKPRLATHERITQITIPSKPKIEKLCQLVNDYIAYLDTTYPDLKETWDLSVFPALNFLCHACDFSALSTNPSLLDDFFLTWRGALDAIPQLVIANDKKTTDEIIKHATAILKELLSVLDGSGD
ncbi:MAG: hypothetical protein JSR80_07610 [Verrucomicrobia bacterium]|nr:hypothetical protein [Verrucomicrobiota bacterium]